MIRPMSLEQMRHERRCFYPDSRNSALLPSTTRMPSKKPFTSKSPIKKHIKNASAFASATSLISTAATLNDDHSVISSSSFRDLQKAKLLRASVLRSVLRLLHQDEDALPDVHGAIQTATRLSLSEPSVQCACVQALHRLHNSELKLSPFTSKPVLNADWDEANLRLRPQMQTTKPVLQTESSERAKSLHQCKEFLLACANEIYEIDDNHSVDFDYAEDVMSSTSVRQTEPQLEKVCAQCGAAAFDYALTLQESSDTFTDYDDTQADQGSQLSEVLLRGDYMSDIEEESSNEEEDDYIMSMEDRAICCQVLKALQEHAATQRRRSNAPNLALKFRVFEALKRHTTSPCKRFAFHRLQAVLRSRRQQRSTIRDAPSKSHPRSSLCTSFHMLLLHNADVLMLVLALVFLASFSACEYITNEDSS